MPGIYIYPGRLAFPAPHRNKIAIAVIYTAWASELRLSASCPRKIESVTEKKREREREGGGGGGTKIVPCLLRISPARDSGDNSHHGREKRERERVRALCKVIFCLPDV